MVYAMPNKLFEALAAGRVILATHGVGEMSDLIEVIYEYGSRHGVEWSE